MDAILYAAKKMLLWLGTHMGYIVDNNINDIYI